MGIPPGPGSRRAQYEIISLIYKDTAFILLYDTSVQ